MGITSERSKTEERAKKLVQSNRDQAEVDDKADTATEATSGKKKGAK